MGATVTTTKNAALPQPPVNLALKELATKIETLLDLARTTGLRSFTIQSTILVANAVQLDEVRTNLATYKDRSSVRSIVVLHSLDDHYLVAISLN